MVVYRLLCETMHPKYSEVTLERTLGVFQKPEVAVFGAHKDWQMRRRSMSEVELEYYPAKLNWVANGKAVKWTSWEAGVRYFVERMPLR